jgi:ABC-2 type transport system ATP-binding protein
VLHGAADVVVEARGLSKRFGDRVALDGLDLQLPRGEIFGLLGPNGAGKSTTLNLFMGFLQPTAGTARIAGLDCARESRAVMRLVGHLPEEPVLFENLTGRELVSFVLSMRGKTARRDGPRSPSRPSAWASPVSSTSSSRATPWACGRSSPW